MNSSAKLLNLALVVAVVVGLVGWLIQPLDTGKTATYTVQSGDTLSEIAKKYGVSQRQLIEWNKDRYPKLDESNGSVIMTGWELTVAPETPGGGDVLRWEQVWPDVRDQVVAWLDVAIQAQKDAARGNKGNGGNGGTGGGTTQPQATAPATDTNGGNWDYDMALQIVELTNAERAKAGLPPLTVDEHLMEIARKRAVEITTDFSHAGLDDDCSNCGENIIYGTPSAEAVVTWWMNSAGHRANILREGITRIGVGVYYLNSGVGYAVQEFGY